jgi:hypothetical protein
MSEQKNLFVNGGLDSKLQYCGPCKNFTLDSSGHIKGDIMQNHEGKKIKRKKVKNQDSIGKTNFFLTTLPLGSFSHIVACRSSSKNTGKMNLILVLNKTSPRTHTQLELDMLGVPGKLVKYVVHSSKSKK